MEMAEIARVSLNEQPNWAQIVEQSMESRQSEMSDLQQALIAIAGGNLSNHRASPSRDRF